MAGMMSVSSMAVFSGLCTSGNAAGIVGMAAYIRTPGNAAGMIPVPVVSGVGITVRTVVHMGSCLGTACDTAYVVVVFPGQCTAVDAAGPVNVNAFQTASRQTAGMISVPVVSGVGITVRTVVHMGSCLGTACDTAYVVVVFPGQCTAVDAAGPVNVNAFQTASRQTAGMISVPVVSGVGITVHTVVHMGSCLGTACDTAYVVAVFPGQRTAADAAKTVLVFFRLCTSPNGAGNVCLIFLGCVPGFRGSFIYRIGDDTACYHGNRYKCYGR